MQYTYQSSLGQLLITVSENRITSLSFGEKMPNETRGESILVTKVQKQLDDYFAGKLKAFDLPLNYQGTMFQMKVWKYLQSIPYGQTVSYQAVAEAIGHPKSARAVGTACKRNLIPIIIPCHRVISATGAIGEYAGGNMRKAKLLKLERA